jgi:hypothetical protein
MKFLAPINRFREVFKVTKRFSLFLIGLVLTLIVGMAQIGYAQSLLVAQTQPANTLFENVRIFDGTSDQLSGTVNVLVVGNKIERISTTTIFVLFLLPNT